MSAQAGHDFHEGTASPPSPPQKNLKAIRAALLPGDVGSFDREFRAIMREATETLDLAPIVAFTERWWRWAWSSADLVGHQTMLENAERLNRGEDVRTLSRAEVAARLSR